MLSVRPDQLLASTSFRLSAIYATLLLVVFAMAGVGTWVATRSVAEHEIRDRVEQEMRTLQGVVARSGTDAAVALIDGRTGVPGSLDYRLIGSDGSTLIDDLELRAPPLGWRVIDLPDNAEAAWAGQEDFLVLTRELPGGAVLSIGDDLAGAERVRAAMLKSLLWIGVIALTLTIAVGVLLTRNALRRMEALTTAVSAVSSGNLSARAPNPTGRSDDIEQLGVAFNAMLDRIGTLVSNVRRVSTDVAHDLRTPLTQARQQLETAAEASTLEDAAEHIRSVQGRLDEVLRLFEAIMRLAEIEAGASRSRFAAVDLTSVIDRVADAYRAEIESNGGTLGVQVVTPAVIEGDADLLTQALANLIENAMKHGDQASPILIELTSSSAGVVSLSVRDHGPGIPIADRERVVSPFVRLDRSRQRPGAGLGLSIVDAVARLHGARLALNNVDDGLKAVMSWPPHYAYRSPVEQAGFQDDASDVRSSGNGAPSPAKSHDRPPSSDAGS